MRNSYLKRNPEKLASEMTVFYFYFYFLARNVLVWVKFERRPVSNSDPPKGNWSNLGQPQVKVSELRLYTLDISKMQSRITVRLDFCVDIENNLDLLKIEK